MTTSPQRRFVLPADLMGALGSISQVTPNVLSTLSTESPAEDTRQRLKERGVLDQNDHTTAGFEPILRTLAAPTGVVQLQLTGGASIVMFQVFSSAETTVSAITGDDGIEIASPAEIAEATRALTEYVGFNMLSSLDVSMRFLAPDALVFSALVDYHRRRQLQGLLNGPPQEEDDIEPATIRSMLQEPSGHPQWMVTILSTMTGIEPAAVAGSAEEVLGSFSSEVAEVAEQIAIRFSIIDRVLSMTSAVFGADGEPVVSQIGCIQAGVHDLLVIEPGPEGVGFVTLPSAMIVSRIIAILEDPVAELAAAGSTGTEEPLPTRFCSECGTPFIEAARFCSECGAVRA